MSAKLTYNNAGRAMVALGNNEKPWWWNMDTSNRGTKDQGYLYPDQMTAQQALDMISNNEDFSYDVEIPQYNGGPVNDYRFVVNKMTKKVISVVSNRYAVQQPSEFAKIIDKVFSNTFVVDTFGTLDGGRLLFATTKVKESSFSVKRDDKVIRMMTFLGSCDYTTPFKIVASDLRTVCWNTFTPQLNKKRLFSARHTPNFKDNVELIQRRLGLVNDYFDSLEKLMQELEKEPIRGDEDIKKFAVELFDINKDTHEKTRNKARDMMRFAKGEAVKYGYNRSALLNGVTELVSHPERRKFGASRVSESLWSQEVRLRSGDDYPLVDTAVEILTKDRLELKSLVDASK